MNEEQITSRVTLCPDGKYRWAYKVNLYRNPSILIDLLKIDVYIFLGMYVLFFIIGVCDGNIRIRSWEDLWNNLWWEGKFFFCIAMFFIALCTFCYYIWARNDRYYAAMFEMNEKGVLHAQMSSQVKKQELVSAIAAMTGVVANDPGPIASSILTSTFTAWNSEFRKVRHVKPVRRRHLIKVNELLTKNRIFVDDPEDYEFVLDYIRQRCPRVRDNKQ